MALLGPMSKMARYARLESRMELCARDLVFCHDLHARFAY